MKVYDINGNSYQLGDMIGSGGQGAVFNVKDNDAVVIKALCYDNTDTIVSDEKIYDSFCDKIKKIISVGEFSNVAVPFVMLQKPLCGYVMLFMTGLQPIKNDFFPYVHREVIFEKGNKKTGKILLPDDLKTKYERVKAERGNKDEFIYAYAYNGGVEKKLKCLAKLANILAKFSDKNIVYGDLSPENIYISKDKESHESWLIDLDNLSLASEIEKPVGTPKYMAPEVFKKNVNTNYSDEYSFAIIAYQYLTYQYPFTGKMEEEYSSWDEDDSNDSAFDDACASGEVPWVWEENDERNRATGGINPHVLLSEGLFQLFDRTFNCQGRNNPKFRPSMWEWYEELVLASESLSSFELKFNKEMFKDNNHKKGDIRIKTRFINSNPFTAETTKRYKVDLYDLHYYGDEDNNKLVSVYDKTIYWDANDDVSAYALSSFDVFNTKIDYFDSLVQFVRKEELFAKSKEFFWKTFNRDIEIRVIEDGCNVKTIKNIENAEIFIGCRGKFVKKILINLE